jgi:hypothetical protein
MTGGNGRGIHTFPPPFPLPKELSGIESNNMSLATARFIVDTITIYLAIGAIFALVFLWQWVGRLDPLAAHGTMGFRVLVFPGVTALWPLFAIRLLRGVSSPPDEWTAHRAPRRRSGQAPARRR